MAARDRGELERGQARRVSQNPRGVLVGYHVCCPRCGYLRVPVAKAKNLGTSRGFARDGDNASAINDVRAVKQPVASWQRAEL